MKTKLLSLLLLFIISNCFSQTIEDLKIATLKMYDAAYNMDFETIVDLTYPKVLDYADRELLIKTIDETFQNDIFQMRFVYPIVIFNYSEMKIIDDKKFYVIKYKSAVRYKHEQKISTDSVAIILNRMKENSKFKTITFEKERNSFLATGETILIAVSDSASKNNWTFINYDNEKIFETLFTKNIKIALGL